MISLKANLLSYLQLRVSYYFYVLSKAFSPKRYYLFPNPHTHTNRLFYLNFKELFVSLRFRRGGEEVRII